MSLPGEKFRKIQQALLSAFPNRIGLALCLRVNLNVNLEQIAGQGSLLETVYQVIQWAEAHGQVRELLEGAHRQNPGNPELTAVVCEMGIKTAGSPSSEPTPPVAVASGSRSLSVSWLHLTDLHFGLKPQGWLWPDVRDEFYRDLKQVFQRSGPWDLVLFSGDLAQSGAPAEYDALDGALAHLWKHFATLGCTPVLLCVPGNHDVNWPDARGSAYRALKAWHTDEELREIFWDTEDNEYRRLMRTVFAPYSDWWRRRALPADLPFQAGLLPGDFSATYQKAGLRLGVVGLNSSFLQLGKGVKEGSLDLDLRQLSAVCGDDAPGWAAGHHVNLLMTHHPREWLAPAARNRFGAAIARGDRFQLHLFGHMHEPSGRSYRIGGSAERRELQGASLFGLEAWEGPQGKVEQRIHGYSAGKIEVQEDTGTLSIWPRILKQPPDRSPYMAPDYDSFQLDENQAVTYSFRPNQPSAASP